MAGHGRTASVESGPPTPAIPSTARPIFPSETGAVDVQESFEPANTPANNVPWDAIDRCLNGDSMLKFGRAGEPHFRLFRLSPDFSSVKWTSKGREQSVSLDDVRNTAVAAGRGKAGGFLPGKQTALFKRNMKKRLKETFNAIEIKLYEWQPAARILDIPQHNTK